VGISPKRRGISRQDAETPRDIQRSRSPPNLRVFAPLREILARTAPVGFDLISERGERGLALFLGEPSDRLSASNLWSSTAAPSARPMARVSIATRPPAPSDER